MSQVPVSEHPLRGLDVPCVINRHGRRMSARRPALSGADRMGDGRCKENRAMPRFRNFPVRSIAWSLYRECLP
jgi:hypothetical protein